MSVGVKCLFLLCISAFEFSHGVVQVEVATLGTIHPSASFLSLTLMKVGPAIDTAVKELRERYGTVFNLTHTYIYDKQSPNCLGIMANCGFLLSEWYYKRKTAANIHAFIAPSCAEFEYENRLMAAWNMLFFTTVATGTLGFSNKRLYPTTVTTGAIALTSFAKLLKNVFLTFGWRSIYMVSELSGNGVTDVFTDVAKDLIMEMDDTQLHMEKIGRQSPVYYAGIMLEFRKISRVFLFVGYSTTFRRFMISAAQLNMTNGEFVYLYLEFMKGVDDPFNWKYNDKHDQIAREAYRSVLLLTPDDSIYDLPSAEICEGWSNETLKLYNISNQRSEMYWSMSTTYAAFQIFGAVLNETIVTNPGFDFRNGKKFAKLFFNRTYSLNYTEMFINTVGDRILALVVRDMDNQTGNFETVLYQDPIQEQLHFIRNIDWGSSEQNGKAPLNMPLCGYRGNQGPCAYQDVVTKTYGIAFGTALLCIMALSASMVYWIRYRLADRNERWWSLDADQLFVPADDSYPNNHERARTKSDAVSISNIKAERWQVTAFDEAMSNINSIEFLPYGREGTYITEQVWVHSYPNLEGINVFAKILSETASIKLAPIFKQFRHSSHLNINAFRGLCESTSLFSTIRFVSGYCSRGSLHDLFERFVQFDAEQCPSLVMDFLEGMRYIHSSVFGFHGSLTGRKCVIDNRFTLKISHVGFRNLKSELFNLQEFRSAAHKPCDSLYWTAPEILRVESEVTLSSDIYSAGIILYQIMTASTPFKILSKTVSPENIINEIRSGGPNPLRPNVDATPDVVSSTVLKNIIFKCWDELPAVRPNIQVVYDAFSNEFGLNEHGTKNLVEKLLQRLDEYAKTLEVEVFRRTSQLVAEQKTCDKLLAEMLPRSIILKLRNGELVQPEVFESVTIMFTDLCGYTELALIKTPIELTNLLDMLYSIFDPVLASFDVYKVETVGNVYMVASGVPVCNGLDHVKEICLLALSLRTAFITSTTRIVAPGVFFRAGMHSGSCAAGVMGQKNPRYCLFGDTVNTASRMGSQSLPNRIHVSSSSAELLKAFSGFRVTERGSIDVKGKGTQITFWLEA